MFAANLIKQKASTPMMSKLLMPFFLIYMLACTESDLCSYDNTAPNQHNITRPWERYSPTSPKYYKKSIGDIIRGALRKRKRNVIPPVIEDKIKPPIEYYLDPPKVFDNDKSKLA